MRALSGRTTTTVMLLAATAFAVALPGCTSDQTGSPEGIGSVDMTVTLATPPSGPNEQIDAINVSLWCAGIDPVLGVPRPAQSSPETFTINVSTSQGPEPYNTIGLFEKQGLPEGDCYFSFSAVSNTGNTECTGEITVAIVTNMTTSFEVVLACIHTPRYGGVRSDGSFNQCAEYRQILVTPTTQSIGNLIDVQTEVYDPDGDPVTVSVETAGACGNVATVGSDTAASCETVSGCEAVVNTVECTGVGACQIIVAVSDDGFDSCTGLLPDGSTNNAARSTINVDCTAPQGLCAGVSCPDTGNDCTVGVCNPVTGECEETDVRNGTECDEGAGICFDGSCIVDPCRPLQASQPEVLDPTIEACIYDTGGDLNPANNSGFWVGGIEPDPGGGAVFVTAHNTPPGGSSSEMVLIRSAGFGTAMVETSVGVLPHNQTTRGVDLRHMDGTYWFASTELGSGLGGVYGATPGVAGFRTFAAGSGIPIWFTSGLTFDASGMEARVTSDLGTGHHIIEAGASTSVLFVDQSPPPIGYNAGSDDHTISLDGRLIIATDIEQRLYDATGGPGSVMPLFDFRTIPGFNESGVGNRIETDPVSGDFFAAWGNGGTTLYRVSADGSSGSIVARNFPGQGIRDLSFGPSSNGEGSSLFVLAISSFDINDEAGTIYEFRFPSNELCEGVTCPDAGECVTNVCDPADGSCKPQNDGINTGCDLGAGPGVCDGAGACVQCNIDAQCPGGETCVNNACEAPGLVCEYEQDFEALDPADPDALANDGWIVFGNVFDGETGDFLFDYGAFPAPNNPAAPAFSLIATGQGGPEQGEQQLVIISDYNARDQQDAGDRVQANTFQQRTIVANDVGKTLTFSFDAKRGNINDPADPACSTTPNPPCDSTALAFIRTVDPAAGFAVTNNITLDTMNLPVEWMRYSIEITIDAGLVGQLLQFGFSATASNDEPSGNVYDNISFCTPGDGGGIELRPLPEIYTTGTAINYGPYRAGGPGSGEFPSDADLLEDLSLMDTAGYNLIRLFGADPVHERILQLAEANFPEMQFQQGLFLGGLAPGPEADNCDSALNDSQVATAISLANTYSNVVTVSVGNETSFFPAFMPLNCLEGYITETRNNVTQPVTADDDYTFYANFFGRSPDEVLRRIDFVSIHTYPFLNYTQWDWRQLGVTAGPLRAEAMMNASLAKAQDNYQVVYDYSYLNASGTPVTVGETRPIVIGETGWKWRQTNSGQEIETYAANPVNAKWYYDLMRSWERSPNGPRTTFIFAAFDEAWKQEFNDDGWGFWDELRVPNYVLCDTPVPGAPPCNDPLYDGAGFFTP